MVNGARLSIVCGCMNRQHMLERALPSWLAAPEVDEVVVVDWSSSTPVIETTQRFADRRIKVVRVLGRQRWIAAQSHNLGVRMASGEILLRLDSDYLLGRDFFGRHPLSDQSFYCGNWRRSRVENERHLTGALYVLRDHVLRVNGYNERIVTYGYEDDDLFERLHRAGLTREDVDYDTLHHIPHPDALRVKHQPITDVEREILSNRRLAHAYPWTSADRMTAWNVRRDGGGQLVCVEASDGSAGGLHFGDGVGDPGRPGGAGAAPLALLCRSTRAELDRCARM